MIPFECPHLHQTYERFESKDPVTYYCDIQDSKPQACKDFDGKPISHGRRYYVPDCCSMTKKRKDG
jgi:hypothetical protein